MTSRALILSGSGRYADPWHPFPATTARIRDILAAAGHDVDVTEDVDAGMAALEGVDLLVVNAGDPWREGPRSAPAASIASFAAALDRGIGVLAHHCATASLRDYPQWAGAIGAVWVPASSFHPPFGRMRVDVDAGLGETFEVDDERYCALQATGAREVVAWHAGDDAGSGREPAAWRRTVGRSRIAVDVLGHDARSYDAAGHAALVTALAEWAAARG